MSKNTNDGLTRSGTGCFIAVPIWKYVVGVKGFGGQVDVLLMRQRDERTSSGLYNTTPHDGQWWMSASVDDAIGDAWRDIDISTITRRPARWDNHS